MVLPDGVVAAEELFGARRAEDDHACGGLDVVIGDEASALDFEEADRRVRGRDAGDAAAFLDVAVADGHLFLRHRRH
jgi:hypothetical protein